MNISKTILFGLTSLSVVGLIACGGDDSTPATATDSGTKDTSTPTPEAGGNDGGTDGSTGNPPPKLGTQIDRIGRPAANTAANNTFNPNANAAGMAKDAYNAAADPTTWTKSFAPEIAKNLAIYDSLDTICGNQALAGANPAPTQYLPLASALADDRLYLNTASTTCTTYLGVELNATGLNKNTDCGGRGLAYDVIDTTYSVVAGGASMVTDGIGPDATKTGGKTFPYLVPAK